MRPAVTYIPCATHSKGESGDIITFSKFEERGLLSETCYDAESGDEYYDDSIMPPLISKEEMDVMYSGDESEDELMSMEMLEDICDGSKSHSRVNRRESSYKIRDRIKQIQTE